MNRIKNTRVIIWNAFVLTIACVALIINSCSEQSDIVSVEETIYDDLEYLSIEGDIDFNTMSIEELHIMAKGFRRMDILTFMNI